MSITQYIPDEVLDNLEDGLTVYIQLQNLVLTRQYLARRTAERLLSDNLDTESTYSYLPSIWKSILDENLERRVKMISSLNLQ